MLRDLFKQAPLSFRDVPLAFAYATIWFAILWGVDYPVDEWTAIVVIAYITLWISREIIGSITLALLRALRKYGLRAAGRAGIEISAKARVDRPAGANLVVTMFLLSVVSTILGCALVPVTYIASAVGLSQLSIHFAIVGIAMLVVGLCALALFFLIPLMLFAKIGNLHKAKNLSLDINRIEESELIVQRRLGVQLGLS